MKERYSKLENSLNEHFKENDIIVNSIYLLNKEKNNKPVYLINLQIDNKYFHSEFTIGNNEEFDNIIKFLIEDINKFSLKVKEGKINTKFVN